MFCQNFFKKSAVVDNVTQQLLKCAYVGTYAAAIRRQRETLVLTLIGGGVFRNSIDDIVQAMVKAHVAIAGRGSLQTVLLPLYESHDRAIKVANTIRAHLLAEGYPVDKIKIKLF